MQYKNRGNRTLPPHVYEIADAALSPCKLYNESQSILISGESGAGKTEATKQCLNYLGNSTNDIYIYIYIFLFFSLYLSLTLSFSVFLSLTHSFF